MRRWRAAEGKIFYLHVCVISPDNTIICRLPTSVAKDYIILNFFIFLKGVS